MMDTHEAIACLAEPDNRKPSEIGDAVDLLYRIHGSYKEIAQQLPAKISDKMLGQRHRIYQLPKGILWKVDEGQIGITQAYQITRLPNTDDQWILAITVVEKKLRAAECENVVSLVLKENWAMRDALGTVTGVRFEEISPPLLMLPIKVDFWFALTQSAWGQGEDWQDLCYRIIRQGVDVDNKEVAAQLEAVTRNVSSQLSSIAETLRQAGERFSEEEVKE